MTTLYFVSDPSTHIAVGEIPNHMCFHQFFLANNKTCRSCYNHTTTNILAGKKVYASCNQFDVCFRSCAYCVHSRMLNHSMVSHAFGFLEGTVLNLEQYVGEDKRSWTETLLQKSPSPSHSSGLVSNFMLQLYNMEQYLNFLQHVSQVGCCDSDGQCETNRAFLNQRALTHSWKPNTHNQIFKLCLLPDHKTTAEEIMHLNLKTLSLDETHFLSRPTIAMEFNIRMELTFRKNKPCQVFYGTGNLLDVEVLWKSSHNIYTLGIEWLHQIRHTQESKCQNFFTNITGYMFCYQYQFLPSSAKKVESDYIFLFPDYTEPMSRKPTLSWKAASQMCEDAGSKLPMFRDQERSDQFVSVVQKAQEKYPVETVPIGLTQTSKSQVNFLFHCSTSAQRKKESSTISD